MTEISDTELIDWMRDMIPASAPKILQLDFDRLIALARDGIKWRSRPDPLGEALNSGNGVYRP